MFVSDRNDRRDPGPIDARQRAQLDRGRSHGRAGVAGADDRVGLSFLDQIDRAADRRIFFPPHRVDRAVAHLHDLGGVDDLDAAVVAAVLLQFRLDLRRVADEKELVDVRILLQRHDRAADNIRRAEIAAHGIQCDFHRSGILRISGRECKIKKR